MDNFGSLDGIRKKVEEAKKAGKRVVLCYGIFDLLHIGHIRYLRQAKSIGDAVIVSVVSDKFVSEGEVVQFSETLRAEAIASLGWIDDVVINPFKDIYEFAKIVRPNVVVKGFESLADNGSVEKEETDWFQNLDIELVTVREDDFGSTSQINRNIRSLPEEIKKYVQLFNKRHGLKLILETIKSLDGLRVLVIGDAIVDEYQYCTAIGKSSKDPALALRYESHDLFAGGSLAVANHVAGFTEKVDLVSVLGEKEGHGDFIRSRLRSNIRPSFFVRNGSPTLIKRRFIDGYSMNKLFEVYVMDDSPMESRLEEEMRKFLKDNLRKYDVVIAADFGHGGITQRMKKLLSKEASYLSINAQSNAGNRGFNNVSKYPRGDYVSLAEHEIRLEMRDMTGKVRRMMTLLSKRMGCSKVAVTRGRKGCMILDGSGLFVQVPSFAQNVVDRVGAGDAFFAVTSLAAVRNVPSEVVGVLGNVAGAIAVGVMGNQKAVDRQSSEEYARTLFLD